MRKIIPAVIVVLAGLAGPVVHAEEFLLGVRGGPSIPQLSDGGNEVSRGYASRLAPNFGLVAEYYFADHFSLVTEIDYSGQGGVRKGVQPITQSPNGVPPLPPGQFLYGDFRNESILNYLEIPLMLKADYTPCDHWRIYIEGGAFVGFLLDAEEHTRGTSQIYMDQNRTPLTIGGQPLPPVSFDSTTDNLGDLNKVNWGVTAGIGVAYLFCERHQLFLDLRGEYGLRAVQKDTATNGNSNTGNLVLSLGYMYSFGR